MNNNNGTTKGLPKTIEGAEARYIGIYDRMFRGLQEEKEKLLTMLRAKTIVLRTKAPIFHEEKLPTLVNQAASILLSCDVETHAGVHKFNQTHRFLLLILDELRKSQPQGEVNFQTERERIEQRDKLRHEQLKLREEISILQAYEFDTEDLADESSEKYNHVFAQLAAKEERLTTVSMLIAKMEGHSLEEEIGFELKIPERSILKRLTQVQRELYEDLVLDFLKTNNNRNGQFFSLTIVEDMLMKLKINSDKFTKDEWRDLAKEALDATKRYFREKENAVWNEYLNSLEKDRHLRPKEGLILESPDDLPEELKLRLENHQASAKRKFEEIEEDFSKRPCPEENIEADDIEEDIDFEHDVKTRVDEIVKKTGAEMFTRIKEEPQDDYDDDASSGDEFIASNAIADKMEDELRQIKPAKNGHYGDEYMDEGEISDLEETPGSKNPVASSSRSNNHGSTGTNMSNPFQRSPTRESSYKEASAVIDSMLDEDSDEEAMPIHNPPPNSVTQNDESQELDCVPLGIVTPQEKIETITID